MSIEEAEIAEKAAFEPLDAAALKRWMDARELGSGPLEDARRLGGGSQNILVHFRREKREFVLRHPPIGGGERTSKAMRREARVLSALAGSAVPHPRLLAACDDDDVLDGAFYLMEPVAGFNPTAGMPAAHRTDPKLRHRMGLSLVEALAKLSAIEPEAVGLVDFGQPENYLDRQLARVAALFESYGETPQWAGPSALGPVAEVFAWLAEHRPRHSTHGILHGDFHLANAMFEPDSGEVAALIDWELATLGDPLVDLGWLLATWPIADEVAIVPLEPEDGFADPSELIAHYRSSGGRDCSHIGWYAIFACWKLAILLEGTMVRSQAGKVPMAVGEKLHARAVALIDKGHRWTKAPPAWATLQPEGADA